MTIGTLIAVAVWQQSVDYDGQLTVTAPDSIKAAVEAMRADETECAVCGDPIGAMLETDPETARDRMVFEPFVASVFEAAYPSPVVLTCIECSQVLALLQAVVL